MAKPRAMPITIVNNVIHITRLLRYREPRGIPAGATRQTGIRSLNLEKDGFGQLLRSRGKTPQFYVDCD
jgi:hypothetical protein